MYNIVLPIARTFSSALLKSSGFHRNSMFHKHFPDRIFFAESKRLTVFMHRAASPFAKPTVIEKQDFEIDVRN
jgi:hypothetical protein